jgi:integrase/recombinase XerD
MLRLVKGVANRAHIRRPVTPHVLRHTFSVTAIQKGISLPSVQRLLGHERLTTTEI